MSIIGKIQCEQCLSRSILHADDCPVEQRARGRRTGVERFTQQYLRYAAEGPDHFKQPRFFIDALLYDELLEQFEMLRKEHERTLLLGQSLTADFAKLQEQFNSDFFNRVTYKHQRNEAVEQRDALQEKLNDALDEIATLKVERAPEPVVLTAEQGMALYSSGGPEGDPRIEAQREEFSAVHALTCAYRKLPALVDNDYPEHRKAYEFAVAHLLNAFMANGRMRALLGDVRAGAGLSFGVLRDANTQRLPLFKNKLGQPAHSQPDGSDWNDATWGNAGAGEFGELLVELGKFLSICNTLKKAQRGDLGDLEAQRAVLAKELADNIIYADLLAFRLKIDLGAAVIEKFNEVSDRVDCGIYITDGGTTVQRRITRDTMERIAVDVNGGR